MKTFQHKLFPTIVHSSIIQLFVDLRLDTDVINSKLLFLLLSRNADDLIFDESIRTAVFAGRRNPTSSLVVAVLYLVFERYLMHAIVIDSHRRKWIS